MIKLTRSQEIMVEAGYPASLFMTLEERKKAWDDNPPKPMPRFNETSNKMSEEDTLKLMAELEVQKKAKTGNRIHKMLDKKVDRTGQRWDARRGRWINENEMVKPMISITTNTRGSTKMAAKDFADMTPAELVAAYNKISGKDPIKKFRDKATGLARMAELTSKKNAEKATTTVKTVAAATAGKVAKAKAEPKEGSTNKRAAEFGARVGSFREKLVIFLDENYRKMVSELDLIKAVYGSKNKEKSGSLTMVLKGAQIMIDKNNLPYALKKEKVEGEISHGLYPK